MTTQRTIYTVIFGPYEKLKEPLTITPGWKYICYTDQDFVSDIWNIIKVETPENPRKQARIMKALFYNYEDTFQSIYIDGSFQINCNLEEFWNKHFKSPFSAPFHPERDCVFEEADQIIAAKRGGREGIEKQIESYRGIVPPHNGIITSGILLREKRTICMDLCSNWLNETLKEGNSLRDQVSFARVSVGKKFHMFNYKYNQETDFIYHPHRDIIIDGVNYF